MQDAEASSSSQEPVHLTNDGITVDEDIDANDSTIQDCSHGRSEGRVTIDRSEWGRNLRLAMACIAGTAEPGTRPEHVQAETDEEPEASSIPDIRRQLYALTRQIDSNIASQVELFVRFDELEGWRDSGARNCTAWMNNELGIERKLGAERLRVGRALRSLPVMRALFRSGQLGWSKVRLLSRIATPELERDLAYMALDASVSDIERVCQEFRWDQENDTGKGGDDEAPADDETSAEREDRKALRQHEQRRCTWQKRADGMTEIRVLLPPVDAQNVLKSLEHSEDQVFRARTSAVDDPSADAPVHANSGTDVGASSDNPADNANRGAPTDEAPTMQQPSAIQNRADALVLMAERSLAFGGTDVIRADRFQVVISVEANTLVTPEAAAELFPISNSPCPAASAAFPERRPVVEGIGPIARSTAKRIACDASVVNIETNDGEPVSIGRRSRIWPAAMRRAIIARDRHCQFEGCDADRHLQIHHLVHWADGGDTSIQNGVCVCHHHHTLIHEGGYRLERATVVTQTEAGPDQGETLGLESRTKRRLLPSRCRFRTVKPAHAARAAQVAPPTHDEMTSCAGRPDHRPDNRPDNRPEDLHTCAHLANERACSCHTEAGMAAIETSVLPAARVEEPRGTYRVLELGRSVPQVDDSRPEKSTRVDHLNQSTVLSWQRSRVGAREREAVAELA